MELLFEPSLPVSLRKSLCLPIPSAPLFQAQARTKGNISMDPQEAKLRARKLIALGT